MATRHSVQDPRGRIDHRTYGASLQLAGSISSTEDEKTEIFNSSALSLSLCQCVCVLEPCNEIRPERDGERYSNFKTRSPEMRRTGVIRSEMIVRLTVVLVSRSYSSDLFALGTFLDPVSECVGRLVFELFTVYIIIQQI